MVAWGDPAIIQEDRMYKGIGHVAFFVTDIQKSLDYYVNQLGLQEHFHLYREDGSLWLYYVRVATGQYVELFPKDVAAQHQDMSYKHLSITVENAQQAYETLTARGVHLTPPKKGQCGAIQFWGEDPDGNKIEFMELCPDSQQMLNEEKYQ